MPVLYANSNQNLSGYLGNKMTAGNAALQSSTALTPTQANILTQSQVSPDRLEPWWQQLGKYAMAAPVEVVDSIGAIIPGIEKGQINSEVYDAIGMPGFGAWVRRNQEGVEVAGGVAGAIAIGIGAEMAASKLVSSGWFAATGLGRVSQGFINMNARAQQAASQSAVIAAQTGQRIGFLNGVSLTGTQTFWQGSRAAAVLSGASQGALKAGVSEAAVIAALHKNDAVWSDDIAQNLMFMGLGVGLGGAFGAISSRAQLNKWANSDTVKLAHAGLRDPGEYEAMLHESSLTGALDWRNLSPTAARDDLRVVPKVSSVVTNIAMNARREEVGKLASGARASTQTAWQEESKRVLQTMTAKGSPGIPNGSFNMKNTPESVTLMEALNADPSAVFGMTTVARIDPEIGIEGQLKAREELIASMRDPKSNATAEVLRTARQWDSETPLVMVNNSWMTVDESKPFLDFKPDKLRATQVQKGLPELQWDAGHWGRFVMREDGVVTRPGGNVMNIEDAPMEVLLQFQDVSNQMLTDLARQQKTLILRESPGYMEIDLALEYAKRGGNIDLTKAGFESPEAAMRASLAQKSAKLDQIAEPSVHDYVRLNLPLPTAMQKAVDQDGAVLKNVIRGAADPEMTMSDLKRLLLENQQRFDMAADMPIRDALDGDFFNFNRSANMGRDSWKAPVLGFFEDTPIDSWSKATLAEQIAERKTTQLSKLRSNKNAPFAATLTQMIMQHPMLSDLMKGVRTLADDQIGGTGGVIGASASQALTQAFRFRNSPALTAAQSMRQMVNRVTEVKVQEVAKRLQPLADRFTSMSAQSSRVLFNQYYSHSAGWDIAKTTILADGKIGFILDMKSEMNARRLGRQVVEGELLMNPAGSAPIALDELGDAMRQALETEMTTVLHERNAIREAYGLEPVSLRKFYTAPPSVKDKRVGYTLDANNRVVPNGTVIADDDAEFARRAAQIQEKLPEGHRFMTREAIQAKVDLWESAAMDFIDPTRMAANSGPQTGKLTQDIINPNSLDQAIDYIKSAYEQTGTGVVRNVFDSQLRSARVHRAAQTTTQGGKNGVKDIWQIYEETMLGVPPSANPTALGATMNKVDEFVDRFFASPAAHTLTRAAGGVKEIAKNHLVDLLNKTPGINQIKNLPKATTYEELADALGPYMPFAKQTEYMEYQRNLSPPWKGKELARHVNRVGTGVILRWLEVAHAAMNLTGVITTMPAIVNARNVPLLGKVGSVGVVDSAKILARGSKRMLEKRSGSDWEYAARMGYTSQDAAETHTMLSLVNSKNSFQRFLTGDPSSPSRIKQLGVEGVASWITDSSENFSRSWAHFIGLELAEYHGITGMKARHLFANKIADDAIANYDSLNRPEIYDSAFGSLYGLFMSYAQNYYQRLFRWVEDKEYKALGINAATQASMFGFFGLPGSRQLAALWGGEEDGDTLMEGIYNRFGSAVGGVVAQGGFNQITTLFGLPAVALHGRGDLNFRHPSLDFAGSGVIPIPPGIEVLKDVISGSWDVIAKSVDPNVPMTSRHAAEIMARNMPNRSMRGAISLLGAGGAEADSYGNLMSQVQNEAEGVFRILGLRSARQQAEIEAYWMNQRKLQIDAQKMDKVRLATRSLVRAGEFDRLPEVFDDYVNAGGNPRNYSNWIKNMIRDAGNTRAENQLLKSLKSPSQQDLARRLELFTTPN